MDDEKRLNKVLDRLDINGGHTAAGTFLAYSITEPLFCYERDTKKEVIAVIADTMKSYVETFYEVENVTVRITSEARDIPAVPIERIEPTCGSCLHSILFWETEEFQLLEGVSHGVRRARAKAARASRSRPASHPVRTSPP